MSVLISNEKLYQLSHDLIAIRANNLPAKSRLRTRFAMFDSKIAARKFLAVSIPPTATLPKSLQDEMDKAAKTNPLAAKNDAV